MYQKSGPIKLRYCAL